MRKTRTNNAEDNAKFQALSLEQKEKLYSAAAALERAGVTLTVRALTKAAQVDGSAAAVFNRLRVAGALPPAPAAGSAKGARGGGGGEKPAGGGAPQLVEAIRSARDLEQLATVANEANACLAAGIIDPNTARALKALLEEQRQALVAARDAPPAAPTGELLCTPDASDLVALYEGIVNGRRRQAVIEFARQQALEDARDFPSGATPEQIRAKLEDLGLDAFGEEQA